MPNVNYYIEEIEKLKKSAQLCLSGSATSAQMDLFFDAFQLMKWNNDNGELTGQAKVAYENFINTLKEPENETEIHKEIKNRAMEALAKMGGNLNSDAAMDAQYYSELYELVSNEKRIIAERTEYEQKRWAEDQFNNEIRNALKTNNSKALDEAQIDREKYGFSDIRKQFEKDGNEQSKLFKSCTTVLDYLTEYSQKENKTEEELGKMAGANKLRNSHLFMPYMKVAYEINNDKDKILYNEEKIQESIKRSNYVPERAEKDEKLANFTTKRDEHVKDIMDRFKRFDQISKQMDTLSKGKMTDHFRSMFVQMNVFNANKWNNENYKENCLNTENMVRFDNNIDDMLKQVSDYIKYKERQIFPGKLGKQRLSAAREMQAILTGMKTSMQEFKNYSEEHKQEANTLMTQMYEARRQDVKNQKVEAQPIKHEAKDPEVEAQPIKHEAKDPEVEAQPIKQEAKNQKIEAQPIKQEAKNHEAEVQPRRARSNSVSLKSPKIREAEATDRLILKFDQKELDEFSKLDREKLLAPYKKFIDAFPEGKFRTDAENNFLRDIVNKTKAQNPAQEQSKKEKISFAKLQHEAFSAKEEADKIRRPKEAEDIKTKRKLSLDPPAKNR